MTLMTNGKSDLATAVPAAVPLTPEAPKTGRAARRARRRERKRRKAEQRTDVAAPTQDATPAAMESLLLRDAAYPEGYNFITDLDLEKEALAIYYPMDLPSPRLSLQSALDGVSTILLADEVPIAFVKGPLPGRALTLQDIVLRREQDQGPGTAGV